MRIGALDANIGLLPLPPPVSSSSSLPGATLVVRASGVDLLRVANYCRRVRRRASLFVGVVMRAVQRIDGTFVATTTFQAVLQPTSNGGADVPAPLLLACGTPLGLASQLVRCVGSFVRAAQETVQPDAPLPALALSIGELAARSTNAAGQLTTTRLARVSLVPHVVALQALVARWPPTSASSPPPVAAAAKPPPPPPLRITIRHVNLLHFAPAPPTTPSTTTCAALCLALFDVDLVGESAASSSASPASEGRDWRLRVGEIVVSAAPARVAATSAATPVPRRWMPSSLAQVRPCRYCRSVRLTRSRR